jgi:hypothetical protein
LRDLTDQTSDGFIISTSLDEDQIKFSYLQRIIEAIFLNNKVSAPSGWHFNDVLLTNLYGLMDMIIKYDDGNTLLRINSDPFHIEFVSYDGLLKGMFSLRY